MSNGLQRMFDDLGEFEIETFLLARSQWSNLPTTPRNEKVESETC
jgi:hypothetical protein